MAGEDALVGIADLLYQKLHTDPSFEKHFEGVDLTELAGKLRSLLLGVFEDEWPEIQLTRCPPICSPGCWHFRDARGKPSAGCAARCVWS